MALMTAPQRATAIAWLADYWSRRKGSSLPEPGVCQLDNPLLESLVDATDAWRDANAAEYNQAIPAGIRSKLTNDEKTLALLIVIAASRNFPLP